MAGNLLNIGKSGLYAAQAGLATTGHNIANASVTGFSRQVVIQAAAVGQGTGSGFIGSRLVAQLATQGRSIVLPTRRAINARHLIMLPGVEVVVEDPGCHGETRSAWDSSTRRRVMGPVVTAVSSTVRTGPSSTVQGAGGNSLADSSREVGN